MASQSATIAATARAAEAREARVTPCSATEPSPVLSGWRFGGAGVVILVVVALLLTPALLAAGSIADASVVGRAAAWLERVALAAPAVLAARALVFVVAVVAIARSDGQG